MGGHYNPFFENHGSMNSAIRHVGDLGNLDTDNNGITTVTYEDKVITLFGIRSIVGRGCVLHEGMDDLGMGSTQGSKMTGNAGGRKACGVVALK